MQNICNLIWLKKRAYLLQCKYQWNVKRKKASGIYKTFEVTLTKNSHGIYGLRVSQNLNLMQNMSKQ